MERGCLLALDYGGTKHTIAVMDVARLPQGDQRVKPEALPGWNGFERIPSPPGADAAYDLKTTFSAARLLLGEAQPLAIGVSFGGPVEAESGLVRLSHHVPGWENIPLAQRLHGTFGAPARVDNDANVAALGEHRFGAGQGASNLMYITVSTGVGGGWILDGKPWRGSQSMAGEIGHTVVDPHGPLCLCGKRGCVERLASGPYMTQDARAVLAAQPERGAVIRRLLEDGLDSLNAATLSQAARMGDELALELLDRSAWALGTGIGNAANLINPERFVLGGGVTKSGERWWEKVRQTARQTALPEITFEILPAALGDDAPLWGALALAQEALVES